MLLGQWVKRPSSFMPGPPPCTSPHKWEYLDIRLTGTFGTLAVDGAFETRACQVCDLWQQRDVKPMDNEDVVVLATFIATENEHRPMNGPANSPPWYEDEDDEDDDEV